MKSFLFRQNGVVSVFLWIGLVISGPWATAQELGPGDLPAGQGRDLVLGACTQCHGVKHIFLYRVGQSGWKTTVENMVLRGAQLLPPEAETAIDYLVANFGPGSQPTPAASPSAGAVATPSSSPATPVVSLPPGPGKELVEARCALCHDLSRVTSDKRQPQEWESVVKTMVELGMEAPADEIRAIVSYLGAQFGKESK